jgi:hypothetical protein
MYLWVCTFNWFCNFYLLDDFQMSTQRRQAKLKTRFGIPCRLAGGEKSAVWNGDEIVIVKRIGSHYLCYVSWNQDRFNMLAWLHKRAVK